MRKAKQFLAAATLAGAALVTVAPMAAAAEPPSPITPDGGNYAKLGSAAAATAEGAQGVPEEYQSGQSVGQIARNHPQNPDGTMADDPNIGSDGQYVGPRE